MIPYSQTSLANRLGNAYFRANWAHIQTGRGKLRKGQFMQQAYPGVYNPKQLPGNQKKADQAAESSARRQFNKVTSLRQGKGLETSGIKIEKRGRVPLKGGGQAGLWKCLVHYKYIDSDGYKGPLVPCEAHICLDDKHALIRSFTLTSMLYERLEDKPYIEAILPPILDQKLEEWKNGSPPNATIIYDVTWILSAAGRSDLPYERQVDLDDVEIE